MLIYFELSAFKGRQTFRINFFYSMHLDSTILSSNNDIFLHNVVYSAKSWVLQIMKISAEPIGHG